MSSIAHQERLMQVLLGPHVSEKSTAVAEASNQVVFKVRVDATRQQVRQAVEALFDVKVERVSIARVAGKAKRFGTMIGRRNAWKKAYVRLAPGSDLDFVGGD
ncbi:MAG: 50S ribosomal protein L23 [Gammaproteobacteria bacterium]|jgi:large subunit ribosomal protein L23